MADLSKLEGDFADKISAKIWREWYEAPGKFSSEIIGIALRKAKADGMREAAEMFRNDWLNETDRFYDAAEAFEKIKAAASKLSPT